MKVGSRSWHQLSWRNRRKVVLEGVSRGYMIGRVDEV